MTWHRREQLRNRTKDSILYYVLLNYTESLVFDDPARGKVQRIPIVPNGKVEIFKSAGRIRCTNRHCNLYHGSYKTYIFGYILYSCYNLYARRLK